MSFFVAILVFTAGIVLSGGNPIAVVLGAICGAVASEGAR